MLTRARHVLRQDKEMKKYRDIVGRHESFDMRLKKLVPGGGAALSYTAHFRRAALSAAALCGAASCVTNKMAAGQHVWVDGLG